MYIRIYLLSNPISTNLRSDLRQKRRGKAIRRHSPDKAAEKYRFYTPVLFDTFIIYKIRQQWIETIFFVSSRRIKT